VNRRHQQSRKVTSACFVGASAVSVLWFRKPFTSPCKDSSGSRILALVVVLAPAWISACRMHTGRPEDACQTPSKESEAEVLIDARATSALSFLKESQFRHGSWRAFSGGTLTTSLCGLAFLVWGQTPSSLEFGDTVSAAARFLEGAADPFSGWIGLSEGSQWHQMYAHGYATLFLATVCPMIRSDKYLTDRIHDLLPKLALRIVQAQSRQGDWSSFWQPHGSVDMLLTTVFVYALIAVRRAGHDVAETDLNRVLDSIVHRQGVDGGISSEATVIVYQTRLPRLEASLLASCATGAIEQAGGFGAWRSSTLASFVKERLVESKAPLFAHSYSFDILPYRAEFALHSANGEFLEYLHAETWRYQERNGSWYSSPHETALALLSLGVCNGFVRLGLAP